MKVSDIILMARDGLSDTKDPYRHETAKLLRMLHAALLHARRIRPDLFAADDFSVPSYDESQLDEDLPMPEFAQPPLADYVIGMVEMADDEFAVDNRAVTLLKRFEAQMMGA